MWPAGSILGNNANVVMKTVESNITNIFPIECDSAAVRVIEMENQFQNGWLAAFCLPNTCCGSPLWQLKIDVFQCCLSIIVWEFNVMKLDLSSV